MSEFNEKKTFEKEFSEDVIDIAAVTGSVGIGAGMSSEETLWTASIDLIAWKSLEENEVVKKEEIQLRWLVDEEEVEKAMNLLQSNTVVKLQVRTGTDSMMLVNILEPEYEDGELETIVKESVKPVYYHDEIFGKFTLEKGIKVFERNIAWENEQCELYFDWHEDESMMKSALKTAHTLFGEQDKWSRKIRMYAAAELVDLANDWLQEEDEIEEITEEMFMDFMSLDTISVYPEGDFDFYFSDGDMFAGHSIVVEGNINGTFTRAQIAG
ncbi:hypothetical protein C1N83_03880 [Priestia aryabhattai]|jgi:hypothetical protein|uniref:DUF2262 domain-containing protein n=1 Tax=Priestia TaxID=2800373 RepID=UPI001455013A|nr:MULTISPECIES: DUF2262 domain-containing protein [Priestia]MBY0004124.1 DUF2262 domain-containing protein [Priestia aryabhattai]MBY0046591.1 DUF2262 domain-containing protein [Priestia aryabhattai]MDE8672719.1 DUF2262 domain-containing protein [Priestia aryabhattai]NLR44788.1 DUF2262 domain-containing protein [Priestia megaterium]WDC87033.1 DUF2262 domain-containing protein [Priestia megaterium]